VEIDHLFVRGLRVVENARVIDESRASDHRPIVAVFDTPATREPELTTPAKP
jgi:endonuclease/exonuclease/phosphatase (EEP) superfamily protein YafD